ncbi:MAG TPA: ATP-binding protein [Terracidiphilus sp.]|jgi:signal transduction histidine kinase
MQQMGNLGSAGRERTEAVVQALATLGSRGESLAEVAHDARNMVTALGLYCDLLEEPGVLAVPFTHYGNELRLVAAASRRLVEKLVSLDNQADPEIIPYAEIIPHIGGSRLSEGSGPREQAEAAAEAATGAVDLDLRAGLDPSLDPGLEPSLDPGLKPGPNPAANGHGRPSHRWPLERGRPWEMTFAEPIHNLAAELLANRNLLSALAGPGIAVTLDTEGGVRAVRMTAEDLTRLLVNLVRNAVEAMPSGGHIRIGLSERSRENGTGGWVMLSIEDSGLGIAPEVIGRIFDSGFTTHPANANARGGWPASHRGLGLAITRSLVETAGGRIAAFNRAQRGACFEIELPVQTP